MPLPPAATEPVVVRAAGERPGDINTPSVSPVLRLTED